MFNNLFGNFLNKKNTDYSLSLLKENNSFLYKGITWKVLEIYSYDWGEECISKEYKIIGDGQVAYLEVERDSDIVILSFSVEVGINEIFPDLSKEDFTKDDILDNLDYSGRNYKLKEVYDGHFKNETNYEMSQNLTCFLYKDGAHFVCIDQWQDGSIDYSVGQTISTSAISNVL